MQGEVTQRWPFLSMIILDPFKARSFASFQWLQFIHSLLIKDTSLNASMLGTQKFGSLCSYIKI